MSGICFGIAFSVVAASVPIQQFTLVWTHSVEKTRWEEDYRVVDNNLILEKARVRGSGAGMEPPDDAERRDGAYEYRPGKSLSKIRLVRSDYAPDYRFCWDGRCRELNSIADAAIDGTTEIFPCRPE